MIMIMRDEKITVIYIDYYLRVSFWVSDLRLFFQTLNIPDRLYDYIHFTNQETDLGSDVVYSGSLTVNVELSSPGCG